MNSTTYVRMHDIVSIEERVRKFSDFTLYVWRVTDKHGASVETEFFHRHSDSLVFHPKITEIVGDDYLIAKEVAHEDV